MGSHTLTRTTGGGLSNMDIINEKHVLVLVFFIGSTFSDNVHHGTLQAPSAGSGPYYPEYPEYGYPPSGPGFNSELDRQGLEAVLGAPVVITAFAAALFGGLLSPLISSGLSRMAEFEIEWPEIKQKVESSSKKKTKLGKRTKLSKARALDNDEPGFSWIKALETANHLINNDQDERSPSKFSKFLSLATDALDKMNNVNAKHHDEDISGKYL